MKHGRTGLGLASLAPACFPAILALGTNSLGGTEMNAFEHRWATPQPQACPHRHSVDSSIPCAVVTRTSLLTMLHKHLCRLFVLFLQPSNFRRCGTGLRPSRSKRSGTQDHYKRRPSRWRTAKKARLERPAPTGTHSVSRAHHGESPPEPSGMDGGNSA